MSEQQKIPDYKISPRRYRKQPGIYESFLKSHTTILINMIIEFTAAIIMIIGVSYFIRFLFYRRNNINEVYFNIFLGAIFFFAVGWLTYIFINLRNHYRLFKNAGSDKENIES